MMTCCTVGVSFDHSDSVMYSGSTTGPSHNNEVCSPYVITWHVDKSCHWVSPASFDKMCKDMKDLYKLEADLKPHGSRELVSPEYVVEPKFVEPLVDSSTGGQEASAATCSTCSAAASAVAAAGFAVASGA